MTQNLLDKPVPVPLSEQVKEGIRVKVGHWDIPVIIAKVNPPDESRRIRLDLKWENHGVSFVYLHDIGKTWTLYGQLN